MVQFLTSNSNEALAWNGKPELPYAHRPSSPSSTHSTNTTIMGSFQPRFQDIDSEPVLGFSAARTQLMQIRRRSSNARSPPLEFLTIKNNDAAVPVKLSTSPGQSFLSHAAAYHGESEQRRVKTSPEIIVARRVDVIHDSHWKFGIYAQIPAPLVSFTLSLSPPKLNDGSELDKAMCHLERRKSNRHSKSPLCNSQLLKQKQGLHLTPPATIKELDDIATQMEVRDSDSAVMLQPITTLKRQKRTRTRRRRSLEPKLNQVNPESYEEPTEKNLSRSQSQTVEHVVKITQPSPLLDPENIREIVASNVLREIHAPIVTQKSTFMDIVSKIVLRAKSPKIRRSSNDSLAVPPELRFSTSSRHGVSSDSSSGSSTESRLYAAQAKVLRTIQATTQRKLATATRPLREGVLMGNLVVLIMEWEKRDAVEVAAERKRAARRRQRESHKASLGKLKKTRAGQQQQQQLAGIVLEKKNPSSSMSEESNNLFRRHLFDDGDDGIVERRSRRQSVEDEDNPDFESVAVSLPVVATIEETKKVHAEQAEDDEDDRPLGMIFPIRLEV